MKNNKKAFLLLSSYLIILFSPKNKIQKEISLNDNYTFHSSLPYGSFSNGDIYIINNKYFKPDDNDNNIYIFDSRYSIDPNVMIINSYKIKSKKEIEEILCLLDYFEKEYPSKWNRSFTSMKNEWIMHNICYELGYNTDSSISVDLNNEDEEKYNSNLLTLFLK